MVGKLIAGLWSPIDRDIYDDEFADFVDGLIREGEAAG